MSSDWVVEAVIQFVKSPLWGVPVNNFIDDQCIIFADDDAEMKHEYTAVFHSFQHLIDSLLTTFIEELGVPLEDVFSACKRRMVAEQTASRDKFVTEFMEYITCLDDFRSFKKVMEQRNVALELEAAKAYQQHAQAERIAVAAGVAPPSQTVETDDERELRLAIEASLAEDVVRQRKAELEDAELQKALALSIVAEEERAAAQKAYLDDCARRVAEREEAARIAQEQARIEAEKLANIQALEAATLAQRKENVIQLATAPPPSDSPVEAPASTVVPVPAAVTAAEVPAVVAPQPVVECLAPTPMPKAPELEVVRLSTTTETSVPPSSSLAPIGGRKAVFSSFKALPSITSQQPTFRELKQEMLGASGATEVVKPSQQAPSQVFVNNDAPSAQQIEERARQMRELRERIAASKKAERETELQNFKSTMGETSSAPALTPQATVDSTKQLTVEIARRFREDLIGETRRQ